MVDDEDVECIVQDLDLCFNDQDWTIGDDVLASCADAWADGAPRWPRRMDG